MFSDFYEKIVTFFRTSVIGIAKLIHAIIPTLNEIISTTRYSFSEANEKSSEKGVAYFGVVLLISKFCQHICRDCIASREADMVLFFTQIDV